MKASEDDTMGEDEDEKELKEKGEDKAIDKAVKEKDAHKSDD